MPYCMVKASRLNVYIYVFYGVTKPIATRHVAWWGVHNILDMYGVCFGVTKLIGPPHVAWSGRIVWKVIVNLNYWGHKTHCCMAGEDRLDIYLYSLCFMGVTMPITLPHVAWLGGNRLKCYSYFMRSTKTHCTMPCCIAGKNILKIFNGFFRPLLLPCCMARENRLKWYRSRFHGVTEPISLCHVSWQKKTNNVVNVQIGWPTTLFRFWGW
jgi:hypothetical protein